jgi:hypothetical protein
VENLFSITEEGFKLPSSFSRQVHFHCPPSLAIVLNFNQDGWGLLFLGKMIYFAPKLKNGIFYTRDTLGYIILSEIKVNPLPFNSIIYGFTARQEFTS